MKEINYRINVDTSRAETDVKNLNDELKETSALTEVDLIINNSQAVSSIGELRRSYRELRNAQLAAGEGTAEFTKLGEAAGALQERLSAVNEVSKDLGGSTTEKLTNSFGRIKEGIVNLDLDKVIQGFSQLKTTFLGFGESIIKTIPGLNALTGATRVFAGALAATGIGAIVVAIGLLIANFDKLKNAGGAIGAAFTGLSTIFNTVKNAAIDLADSLGLVDKAALASTEASAAAAAAAAKSLADTAALKEKYRQDDLSAEQKALEAITKRRADELIFLNEQIKKENLAKLGQYAEIEFRLVAFEEETQRQLQAVRDKFAGERVAAAAKVAAQSAADAKAAAAKVIQDAKDAEEARKAAIAEIENEFSRTSMDISTRRINAAILAEETKFIKLGKVTEVGLDVISAKEVERQERSLKAVDYNYVQQQLALAKQFEKKLLTEEQYNLRVSRAAKEAEDARIVILAAGVKAQKEISDRKIAITQAEVQAATSGFNQVDLLTQRAILMKQGEAIALKTSTEEQAVFAAEAQQTAVNHKLAVLRAAGITEGEEYQALINQKLAADNAYAAAKKALDDAELANKRANAQALLSAGSSLNSALQGLATQLYANELAAAGDNYDEQEKVRKKAFEANKAFAIAGAIISTAQAVIAGLGSGLTLGPAAFAAGPLLAGLAAATGAIQIAAIAATEYTPGTRPSTPPATTPPSINLPSAAGAEPNINFVGAGVGGSVGGLGAQMPFPLMIETQVSVSETEITSTQGLLSSYESGAGLGGG
jgi:hypothetical protein